MIVTTTFQRKTFRIQAIQATAQNMGDLALWCGGEMMVYRPEAGVMSPDRRARQWCIQVEVGRNAGRVNKSHAFVGDWVTRLSEANHYRVYREKTFLEAFEEIRTEMEKYQTIVDTLHKVMRDNMIDGHSFDPVVVFDEAAKQLVSLV